jgi:hypothetical protein
MIKENWNFQTKQTILNYNSIKTKSSKTLFAGVLLIQLIV